MKGNLVGLLTRASLKDKKLRPKAGAPSLDKKGRLLCGAAIGTREARVSRPLTLSFVNCVPDRALYGQTVMDKRVVVRALSTQGGGFTAADMRVCSYTVQRHWAVTGGENVRAKAAFIT